MRRDAEKPDLMNTIADQGLDRSRDFEQSGTRKSGLLYKSARKLPRKREILKVKVEFGKIIGIERFELCFVNV
jgi:hypothetical protein